MEFMKGIEFLIFETEDIMSEIFMNEKQDENEKCTEQIEIIMSEVFKTEKDLDTETCNENTD